MKTRIPKGRLRLGGLMFVSVWLACLSTSLGEQILEEELSTVGRQASRTHLAGSVALIQRLQRTNLVHGEAIYRQLGLEAREDEARNPVALRTLGKYGFLTRNPFETQHQAFNRPQLVPSSQALNKAKNSESKLYATSSPFYGREAVLRWYVSMSSSTVVCGVRFVDSGRADYELRTFSDANSALAEGYVITHRYHCGTCSSLRDRATYLDKPDLTAPARSCPRALTPSRIKTCLMDQVGLAEFCAKTCTYNVIHTSQKCSATCIRFYGLWNVLSNTLNEANTDALGNLNPCLACDEYTSGPIFQYTSGRTRRSSGLVSAIQRSKAEVYSVNHHLYFE